MMIAVPPENWQVFREISSQNFATTMVKSARPSTLARASSTSTTVTEATRKISGKTHHHFSYLWWIKHCGKLF